MPFVKYEPTNKDLNYYPFRCALLDPNWRVSESLTFLRFCQPLPDITSDCLNSALKHCQHCQHCQHSEPCQLCQNQLDALASLRPITLKITTESLRIL